MDWGRTSCVTIVMVITTATSTAATNSSRGEFIITKRRLLDRSGVWWLGGAKLALGDLAAISCVMDGCMDAIDLRRGFV